jgi:hypothetical protein
LNRSPTLGTLFTKGDNRLSTCTVRSIFTTKQNISYSFEPSTFDCLTCSGENAHKVAGPTAGRQVFVLTDHCFPPLIQSKGGCVQVIRLEFATIMELGNIFTDVITGSSLPVGSVVLISSASHLASVGTAGYAEDVVRCTKLLLQAFRDGITVKHGVPILMEGTDSPELIRSLSEIDGWLSHLNGGDSFPLAARKAALLAQKNAGSGTQADFSQRIRLPKNLSTFEKVTWASTGWDNLPRTVGSLAAPHEKDIIDALLTDLNNSFSFEFGTDVIVNREGVGQKPTAKPRKIIVIGASNAGRLSTSLEELGECTSLIKMPSWMPNSTTIAAAAEELASVSFEDNADNIIVFFNLDCAAYYTRQVDGSVIPSRQLNGSFHIDGELVVAPKDFFAKTLKVCLPLLQLHPTVKKIILSPSPRYWLTTCCDDIEHVNNFLDPSYEDDLFRGLDELRRNIKDFVFTSHLKNCVVASPMQIYADHSSKTTSHEVRDAVRDHWGTDPVHPDKQCIEKLAIYVSCHETSKGPASSASSTTVQPPAKRLKWASEAPPTSVTPVRTFNNVRGGQRGQSPWGRRPWQRGRGGRGGRGRRPPCY